MTTETTSQTDGPDSAPTTKEEIAHDMVAYLKENTDVCAEGNVHGWRWIRYHNGSWKATKYGNEHRKSSYVHGETLSESQVIKWLVNKPVQLIPASDAFQWSPKESTVWDDAETQEVFTSANRCFWCGQSENNANLSEYQTHEHGLTDLCDTCYPTWDKAGEIASTTN